MDAKELRIGNYIFVAGGFVQQIWETSLDGTIVTEYYITSTNKGAAHSVSPIPLTEEWLEKFGFTNYDENKWNLPSRMDLMMYNDGVTYLSGPLHVNLFYVHQLQNLYFALTGEELELND